MTEHSASMANRLTDEVLDAAILRALYPEERKTNVQLSVDVENSGGAIRCELRCLELQQRGLIFSVYEINLHGDSSQWKLTAVGRMQVRRIVEESETQKFQEGGTR